MFFGQIKTGKIVFFIILDKKSLFRPEKGSFEKQKNFPYFLSKNGNFCHILIKSSDWLYARYHTKNTQKVMRKILVAGKPLNLGVRGPGACFAKVPIINGPGKLFPFTL